MALTAKFTWPASTEANNFTTAEPLNKIPFDSQKAVRYDNVSSYGILDVIVERVESFIDVEANYVFKSIDATNWDTFMQYAVQGGAFYYYPDSASGTKIQVTMVEKDFNLAYKAMGLYSFKFTMRKVIT